VQRRWAKTKLFNVCFSSLNKPEEGTPRLGNSGDNYYQKKKKIPGFVSVPTLPRTTVKGEKKGGGGGPPFLPASFRLRHEKVAEKRERKEKKKRVVQGSFDGINLGARVRAEGEGGRRKRSQLSPARSLLLSTRSSTRKKKGKGDGHFPFTYLVRDGPDQQGNKTGLPCWIAPVQRKKPVKRGGEYKTNTFLRDLGPENGGGGTAV